LRTIELAPPLDLQIGLLGVAERAGRIERAALVIVAWIRDRRFVLPPRLRSPSRARRQDADQPIAMLEPRRLARLRALKRGAAQPEAHFLIGRYLSAIWPLDVLPIRRHAASHGHGPPAELVRD